MQKIKYTLFLTALTSSLIAQPKVSGRLGVGIASPDYKSFSKGEFPDKGFFETVMLNYSFSYQFYSNARVGFSRWVAFTSDKYAGEDFTRSFKYRSIFVETYFFIRKKIEINFTLGPMINKGEISMAAKQSIDAWDTLMEEFNNSGVTVTASDPMTSTFLGFTSAVGVRYYIKPYMAGEIKIGFISNFYNSDNWSFQGQDIKGPNIDIKNLPLFTFGLVYGW